MFRLHKMPKVIMLVHDSKFTSHFWSMLFNLIGMKLSLSTAFHPQTDSQIEHMNRMLEDMLHAYASLCQDNWDKLLMQAEFSYNSFPSITTQLSPFQMNYRSDPIVPTSLCTP